MDQPLVFSMHPKVPDNVAGGCGGRAHLSCFVLGSAVQAAQLLLGSLQLPSPCIAAQEGLELLLAAALLTWPGSPGFQT